MYSMHSTCIDNLRRAAVHIQTVGMYTLVRTGYLNTNGRTLCTLTKIQ